MSDGFEPWDPESSFLVQGLDRCVPFRYWGRVQQSSQALFARSQLWSQPQLQVIRRDIGFHE